MTTTKTRSGELDSAFRRRDVAFGLGASMAFLTLCTRLPEGATRDVLTFLAPVATFVFAGILMTARGLFTIILIELEVYRTICEAREAVRHAKETGAPQEYIDALRSDAQKVEKTASLRRLRKVAACRGKCSLAWLRDLLRF